MSAVQVDARTVSAFGRRVRQDLSCPFGSSPRDAVKNAQPETAAQVLAAAAATRELLPRAPLISDSAEPSTSRRPVGATGLVRRGPGVASVNVKCFLL